MALLWKTICNSGDPMSLRHPVQFHRLHRLHRIPNLSFWDLADCGGVAISVGTVIICGGSLNTKVSFTKETIFCKRDLYRTVIICGDSTGILWRLPKHIGLFYKRALQKRRDSAKETHNFEEPTNRSHPIRSASRCRSYGKMIGLFCKRAL